VENRSHWEDGFAIPARSRVPLASARSDRKSRTGLGPHPQATKSWRKPVILRASFPPMLGGLESDSSECEDSELRPGVQVSTDEGRE
jgi:hypothetical protein